jgi:hypothetical protein
MNSSPNVTTSSLTLPGSPSQPAAAQFGGAPGIGPVVGSVLTVVASQAALAGQLSWPADPTVQRSSLF